MLAGQVFLYDMGEAQAAVKTCCRDPSNVPVERCVVDQLLVIVSGVHTFESF